MDIKKLVTGSSLVPGNALIAMMVSCTVMVPISAVSKEITLKSIHLSRMDIKKLVTGSSLVPGNALIAMMVSCTVMVPISAVSKIP